MNEFRPEGYASTREAIGRAAECWFPERLAALEKAVAAELQEQPDNGVKALARALAQPVVLANALQFEFHDIEPQTVNRLRNLLHQGKLTAHYFEANGRHSVVSEFWATEEADGVLESGVYWPFGQPTRWYESRPNHSLFLLKSELDALLSEQPAKKRRFPQANMPKLVAALRTLDDLPNRADQLEALCNMPEFCEFTITDAIFRAAMKEAGPRSPGRKSRRQ
jgi:hypothetical protein